MRIHVPMRTAGWLLPLLLLASPASSQVNSAAVELANLRQDVNGLRQTINSLQQRVEQLERENAQLRSELASAGSGRATTSQVNNARDDMKSYVDSAVASVRRDFAGQMENMGKQVNRVVDSVNRGQTAPAAQVESFSDDYPKEGVSYTVVNGDVLTAIARKFGARTRDIVNANRLPNGGNDIKVGQNLWIPIPPAQN